MTTGQRTRISKSVSSLRYCQERFSCDNDSTLANYVCDECGSLQCDRCEEILHQLSKHFYHYRKRLSIPTNLCQAKICSSKNFADVQCEDCGLILCNDCNHKIHGHGVSSPHGRRVKRTNNTNILRHKVTALNSLNMETNPTVADAASCDNSTPFSTNLSNSNDNDTFSDAMSYETDICQSGSLEPGSNVQRQQMNRCVKDMQSSRSPEDSSQALVSQQSKHTYRNCKSFLLADQHENLNVTNEDAFIAALGCQADTLVKVLSIFGNTGDGKSYTLNQAFFGGLLVFKTLSSQLSCTIGVWAAYDHINHAVVIDTEGLLGIAANENQRSRLLLKVLAISDIVVYRSRAERLHNDLFQFLGDASKAYRQHFSMELRAAVQRGQMGVAISDLGPAVVIFHETQHTEPLTKDSGMCDSPESFLQQRFRDLELNIDAFSSVEYVGTKTVAPPTDFAAFLTKVQKLLLNSAVRSPRKPAVIYNALKLLNEKFNGEIQKSVPSTFPDEYFSCNCCCLVCGSRCTRTMNHCLDEFPHVSDIRCQYQHQYDNKVLNCKACYEHGRDEVVIPKTSGSTDSMAMAWAKFAWSGYTLECRYCGVIYRSRQYWFGNEEPDRTVVRTRLQHVWPGTEPAIQGNSARRLVDGLSYVSEGIANLSSKPAQVVGHWVTDQIAPAYWVPNSMITNCVVCDMTFSDLVSVHHCRACGEGCCDTCSTKKRLVPERGWTSEPVRVCDKCIEKSDDDSTEDVDIRARRVGEVISSTLGNVASLVNIPLTTLCDSARPDYWESDAAVTHCRLCQQPFNQRLLRHHCRSCGRIVCEACSLARLPVPSRGWPHAVRVCRQCEKTPGLL